MDNEFDDSISGYNKNIIATITHDLKTPALAQIRALELLLKGNFGEINDSQRNFIKEILNSSNNMLNMLVNMLWLYKLDNKRIAINKEEFNINEVIYEIFNENKLITDLKNNNFELHLCKNNPFIIADKMHIKRIITNLIINALFHSKENSIIVIQSEFENNNFIFKVINNGEFIDEEYLKFVFDKNKAFLQKNNGLSTGLGLYLSNILLELNNGKMFFNSQQDGINTFGFSLKLPIKVC